MTCSRLAAVVLVVSASGSLATAQSWNLAGGGSWNDSASWDPATVPNAIGASVTFSGAATGQTANRTILYDVQQTVGTMVLNNDVNFSNIFDRGAVASPGLILDNAGAGASITVNGSGTGKTTFTAGFRLDDNVTATVNSTTASSATGALEITGGLTGIGGFTKEGVGMITLSTNTKSYTGPTALNNGRMRMSAAGRTTATSSFTINGGQLDLIANGSYTLGTGPLNLNGAGPASGPYALFPGAIRPDTSVVATITNPVVLQTTSTVHMQGSATGALTFTGAVSGPGGLVIGSALHDANVGQVILDTSANSYTGGTTINAGRLVAGLASTNAFGTGNVSVLSANSVFAGASASISIVGGANNVIADNAVLSLAGGNVAGVADDGYANLGAGVNETIGGLILGGVTQTSAGTYGATGSGANFIFDDFFSGTGLVTLTAPAGVPGDYNGNGVVDAADYVLWRNGGPLQNEVDAPGTVNAADYTAWRARFGNTSGAGSALGAAAVPEPTTLALIVAAISLVMAARRK